MFVLNVDMNVKPGSGQSLEKTFREVFVPAIAQQEGFARAELLRLNDDSRRYRLAIGFENQPLQQKWVAAPLHEQVWPQMEAHASEYSVQNYTLVQE